MIIGILSIGCGAEEHQYYDDYGGDGMEHLAAWGLGGAPHCSDSESISSIVCINESYIYSALVTLAEARTSFRGIIVYNPY